MAASDTGGVERMDVVAQRRGLRRGAAMEETRGSDGDSVAGACGARGAGLCATARETV